MSTKSFWDRKAAKYASKPIDDQAAYEQKLSRLRAFLKDTDHVLEIGCGTGSTALRLASDVGQVTATDGSAGMIEIAKSKPDAGPPARVTFLQSDAADMIEGRPFDAICAFSLLHLVRDLPVVLESVCEQLRPGGLFISKTVCLKDGPIWMRTLLPVLKLLGIAPHVAVISRDELIEHILAAGFEVEETRYFGKSKLSPFVVARRTAG